MEFIWFWFCRLRFCAWPLPLLAAFPDSYRELVVGEGFWGRTAPTPLLTKAQNVSNDQKITSLFFRRLRRRKKREVIF